jgi:hypothetical protein
MKTAWRATVRYEPQEFAGKMMIFHFLSSLHTTIMKSNTPCYFSLTVREEVGLPILIDMAYRCDKPSFERSFGATHELVGQ